MAERICSFPNCGRRHSGRGYCAVHAAQARRGEALRPIKVRVHPLSPIQRFERKYEIRASGCWDWLDPLHKNGYGKFFADGAAHYAHRWSYEHFVGPIPDGLVIDHLCRNRACVNPEHMEPVTQQTNVRRGEAGERLREWLATHPHPLLGVPRSAHKQKKIVLDPPTP